MGPTIWLTVPCLVVFGISHGQRALQSAKQNKAVVVPFSNRHDFWTWPAKTVSYYLDPAYTPDEKAKIRKAMDAVEENLFNCIKYEEVVPTAPKFKLKITPFDSDNITASKYCKSWPGIYKPYLSARPRGEQRCIIGRGAEGCMGTQHELMKMFTIALGRRNEHQRPDRDEHLAVNHSALQPGAELAFRPHPPGAFLYVCSYDYCSITHNQADDFAVPGSKMFTVKKAPHFIPMLGKLSGCDCKELTQLYKCKAELEQCQPTDCEGQKAPAA